jgi:hypothetical protein
MIRNAAVVLSILICMLSAKLHAQSRYYTSQEWEDATVIDDDQWNIEAEDPTTCTLVQTTDQIVHSGSRALKIQLSNPDKLYKRAEIAHTHKATMGDQYFYRFSMYLPTVGFPQNNNDGTTFTIITQWHGSPDFGLGETWRVPNLALRIHEDGKLGAMLCVNAAQVNDNTTSTKINFHDENGNNFDIPKGQWVTFEVSVKWTHTAAGYLDIWMDGNHIIQYTGPTSYNDAQGPYLKMGIYRTPWITETETIYFDNLQILRNGLIVHADADTHVRGGSYENTNYGSTTSLTTKFNLNQPEYDRQIYIHFDYSQFADYALSTSNLYVQVYSVNTSAMLHADDVEYTWDEDTLTYAGIQSLNFLDYQGSAACSTDPFEIEIPDAIAYDDISLCLTFDTLNAMMSMRAREYNMITQRPFLFLDLE